MYIRWVVRKHKNAATANVVFHDAYLVESYRDARNTPRQQLICYLGNIRQIDGGFPPIERELFLVRAERILASEPAVPSAEREHVIHLLHQKVSKLTPDEIEIAFRNHLRWYYHWRRQHGDVPTTEELLHLISTSSEDMDPM